MRTATRRNESCSGSCRGTATTAVSVIYGRRCCSAQCSFYGASDTPASAAPLTKSIGGLANQASSHVDAFCRCCSTALGMILLRPSLILRGTRVKRCQFKNNKLLYRVAEPAHAKNGCHRSTSISNVPSVHVTRLRPRLERVDTPSRCRLPTTRKSTTDAWVTWPLRLSPARISDVFWLLCPSCASIAVSIRCIAITIQAALVSQPTDCEWGNTQF